MSLVIVWVGSLRNSSQVQFFSLSTSPVIENVQSVSGVRGVGPAERTGKSLTRYWPGGRRPACPWSLGRPRKAREMKVTLEAYAQNAADVPSRRREAVNSARLDVTQSDLRRGSVHRLMLRRFARMCFQAVLARAATRVCSGPAHSGSAW